MKTLKLAVCCRYAARFNPGDMQRRQAWAQDTDHCRRVLILPVGDWSRDAIAKLDSPSEALRIGPVVEQYIHEAAVPTTMACLAAELQQRMMADVRVQRGAYALLGADEVTVRPYSEDREAERYDDNVFAWFDDVGPVGFIPVGATLRRSVSPTTP